MGKSVFEIKLGDTVRSKVSGFAGVVIKKCEYLHGQDRYEVTARELYGGDVKSEWFDASELECGSKNRLFGDMTLEEIEEFEKKANAIVLFSDERGVAFQKGVDSPDEFLVIQVDGVEKPLILHKEQVVFLMRYLGDNFSK